MRIGAKKIYHLEAWVIKTMSLYKVRAVCRVCLTRHLLICFRRASCSTARCPRTCTS